MRVLAVILSFSLAACGSGDGTDGGGGRGQKAQEAQGRSFRIENRGIGQLKLTVRMAQASPDDACDKPLTVEQRTLVADEAQSFRLEATCRRGAQFVAALEVVNLTTGSGLLSESIHADDIQILCDDAACLVTCAGVECR